MSLPLHVRPYEHKFPSRGFVHEAINDCRVAGELHREFARNQRRCLKGSKKLQQLLLIPSSAALLIDADVFVSNDAIESGTSL